MTLRVVFVIIVLGMFLYGSAASAELLWSDNFDVKTQSELLFSDNFSITAESSKDFNSETGAPRQDGSVGSLTYSKRVNDRNEQALTGTDLGYGQEQALYLNSGNYYLQYGPDLEMTWASPNYDFIRYGLTTIRYKVDPEEAPKGNCSTVMFGSSYQGTWHGCSRAYWNGDGNVLAVSRTGWCLEYDMGRISGPITDHDGYFDVRIDMNNSGANTTLDIWIDDVKVVDNWHRVDRFGRGYGYTNNYITLAARCNEDNQAATYYDDFSVTSYGFTPAQVKDLNFQAKERQSGSLAPLTYSKRTDARDGWISLSGVCNDLVHQQGLGMVTGQYFNTSPDHEYTWVSPNHDFIATGLTKIKYKVDPSNDVPGKYNQSEVLFGSSNQGTFNGYWAASWGGNGTRFGLNSDGGWTLFYDSNSEPAPLATLGGSVPAHDGYYDVTIDMDNRGSQTKLNIFVDGINVVKDWARVNMWGKVYGYTNNYISFGCSCDESSQQSTMYDDISVSADSPAPVYTIGQFKLQPDGTPGKIVSAEVTMNLGWCYYVESADGTSGIRINQGDTNYTPGTKLNILGLMETSKPYGTLERMIDPVSVELVSSDSPTIAPLLVSNRTIGGADDHYSSGENEATLSGQIGVKEGSGANNVGCLVEAYGKVVYMPREDGVPFRYRIKLDDGSKYLDGAARDVRVIYPSGIDMPKDLAEGDTVCVTGISSQEHHLDKTSTSAILIHDEKNVVKQ